MRCPTLAELPPPPPGKTGWPWTEESEQLPDTMRDGSPWPRVSIVTPSYNQGQFIEETIRSVLLQGYPNLEYIVIDGGSTDKSVEVIRKYERWLTHWVSEPDRGQAHAVNKGWGTATGDLLGWLNSDDLYTATALASVRRAWLQDGKPSIVYGDARGVSESLEPRTKKRMRDYSLRTMLAGKRVPQPATFITRQLYQTVGPIRESLTYALDYEFFFRAWLQADQSCYVPSVLAHSRRHSARKSDTGGHRFVDENLQVLEAVWRTEFGDRHQSKEWVTAFVHGLTKEAQKYIAAGAVRPAVATAGKAMRCAPRLAPCITFRLLRAIARTVLRRSVRAVRSHLSTGPSS